jgi:hypothetical protein
MAIRILQDHFFDPSSASARSTSPGCACRPAFDFWNTGTPSRSTSKRPPPEGISVMSALGYARLISAARLVARGS